MPGPPSEVSIEEAYDRPLGTHRDRPWVGLCMVASIDGSTVVDGASGALSSANDSAVLLRLRRLADVIVVGASTASGEGYGPPSKPGQRIGLITRSGSIDTSSELFTSGSGFIITTETAEVHAEGVDVIRTGRDSVDFVDATKRIRELIPGTDYIQVEGGPSLNGAIASAGAFDELNITTSPSVVGGAGPRLVHHADDLSTGYDLVQVVVDDRSFIFSRWRRRPDEAPASP